MAQELSGWDGVDEDGPSDFAADNTLQWILNRANQGKLAAADALSDESSSPFSGQYGEEVHQSLNGAREVPFPTSLLSPRPMPANYSARSSSTMVATYPSGGVHQDKGRTAEDFIGSLFSSPIPIGIYLTSRLQAVKLAKALCQPQMLQLPSKEALRAVAKPHSLQERNITGRRFLTTMVEGPAVEVAVALTGKHYDRQHLPPRTVRRGGRPADTRGTRIRCSRITTATRLPKCMADIPHMAGEVLHGMRGASIARLAYEGHSIQMPVNVGAPAEEEGPGVSEEVRVEEEAGMEAEEEAGEAAAGEAAATVEQEVMEATAGQVQTPLPAMEMMAMVTEEVILLAKVVSVVDVVEVGAGEAIVVPAEAPVEVEPVVHRATVPAGEGTE
ncbi:hypothetical protein GLOTRDRAFT_96510 [Gloeophyllum trabeum ATCC 11539]|uniref:Uncharacterized protein n=1 Tax=Gloeophyllum trabeum (strain ATCC 11539 / FP-39264 / Madison 617) TaxID=670483 RepID=S7RFR8_GLOTA|nr:uncharacterized protein GLOTRDRAFT_96510 [Gloeophyllum trabeum ATCC 11539]EPQ51359.1 hypothetical protein GLOTRDRAFT_96510 [Gloeophyllum trabeum ATCC 11539]